MDKTIKGNPTQVGLNFFLKVSPTCTDLKFSGGEIHNLRGTTSTVHSLLLSLTQTEVQPKNIDQMTSGPKQVHVD